MNNENTGEVTQAKPIQSGSIQPPGRGWGVKASPFNAVKLELAIVIIIGVVLGLVTTAMTGDDWNQVLIMGCYGLLAGGGLVVRTRYLASRHLNRSDISTANGSPANNSPAEKHSDNIR